MVVKGRWGVVGGGGVSASVKELDTDKCIP